MRKILNILGLICLLLVLGAGGTVGYLAARGTLTRDSLKTAVAAVTSRPADAAASQPAPASEPAEPAPANQLLAAGRVNDAAEMGRLEMFRSQVAREQAMVEAARLDLLRQREKLDQDRKLWEADRLKQNEGSQQGGAQKEREYLSSIRPAQALALLRAKPEDEAAAVLMAMEVRRGKKIIELCKSADDMKWALRILELIRQQDTVQAEALAGG